MIFSAKQAPQLSDLEPADKKAIVKVLQSESLSYKIANVLVFVVMFAVADELRRHLSVPIELAALVGLLFGFIPHIIWLNTWYPRELTDLLERHERQRQKLGSLSRKADLSSE